MLGAASEAQEKWHVVDEVNIRIGVKCCIFTSLLRFLQEVSMFADVTTSPSFPPLQPPNPPCAWAEVSQDELDGEGCRSCTQQLHLSWRKQTGAPRSEDDGMVWYHTVAFIIYKFSWNVNNLLSVTSYFIFTLPLLLAQTLWLRTIL